MRLTVPCPVTLIPLLRILVAADNAAMLTELSKADPPKRKRRWSQFSLRTLLIFTAIRASSARRVTLGTGERNVDSAN
jgi:hypothetical protein